MWWPSASIAPLALLALLAFSLGACGGGEGDAAADDPQLQSPPPRPVRTVVVTADTSGRQWELTGRSQAPRQAMASFRVPGRVETRPVRLGSSVERGQVLATLDDSDFELRVQEAQARHDEARAQARNASDVLRRARTLYATDSVARSALDSAEARHDAAAAALEAAQRRLRLAQSELGYTRLTAPAAGQVVELRVEAGENVAAGQAVVMLATGDGLEVEVAVPEGLIARVKIGQRAEVSFSADGRSATGVVTEVGAGPRAGGGTFPVVLRLEDPDPALRTGRAADVTLFFDADQDGDEDGDTGEAGGAEGRSGSAVRVPPQAVAADDRGRYVWVVEADASSDSGAAGSTTAGSPAAEADTPSSEPSLATVRRRPVETGELLGDGLVVTSGLAPGERIVIAGVSQLEDGQQVRLLDHDPLAEASSF